MQELRRALRLLAIAKKVAVAVKCNGVEGEYIAESAVNVTSIGFAQGCHSKI